MAGSARWTGAPGTRRARQAAGPAGSRGVLPGLGGPVVGMRTAVAVSCAGRDSARPVGLAGRPVRRAGRGGDTPKRAAEVQDSFRAATRHDHDPAHRSQQHEQPQPTNHTTPRQRTNKITNNKITNQRLNNPTTTRSGAQTCASAMATLGAFPVVWQRYSGWWCLVLSSAKIGTATWRYYQDTVAAGACEYYTGHGEAPGRWAGSGLGAVGLVDGARVTGTAAGGAVRPGPAPRHRSAAGPRLAGGRGHRPRPDVLRAEVGQRPVGAGGCGHRRAGRRGARRGGPRRAGLPGDARGVVPARQGRGGAGRNRRVHRRAVRPPHVTGGGPAAAHPRAGAEQGALRGRGVAHRGRPGGVRAQEGRRGGLPGRAARRADHPAARWCSTRSPSTARPRSPAHRPSCCPPGRSAPRS